MTDLPQRLGTASSSVGMGRVVDRPDPDARSGRRAPSTHRDAGCALGKRVGYGLLVGAMVAFVVAATTGFPSWAVTQ